MAQRGGGEAPFGNFSECSRVQLTRTDLGGGSMKRLLELQGLVEHAYLSLLDFLDNEIEKGFL